MNLLLHFSVSLAVLNCCFCCTDRDFEPPCEEEDDEETIEVEEQQDGNDAETQRREIELLRQEGTLPLDQLLSTLTLPQVQQPSKIRASNEHSVILFELSPNIDLFDCIGC